MLKKIPLLHAIFLICSSIVFSDEVAAKRTKTSAASSERIGYDQPQKTHGNTLVKQNTEEGTNSQKTIEELVHNVLSDLKRNPAKEKEFEKLKTNFDSLKSSNLSEETKPKFAQLLVDLYNILGVISFSAYITKLIEELNAKDDVLQILNAIKKLKTTNSNQTYKVLYKAFKNNKSQQ